MGEGPRALLGASSHRSPHARHDSLLSLGAEYLTPPPSDQLLDFIKIDNVVGALEAQHISNRCDELLVAVSGKKRPHGRDTVDGCDVTQGRVARDALAHVAKASHPDDEAEDEDG